MSRQQSYSLWRLNSLLTEICGIVVKTIHTSLKGSIQRSKEFEKKGLATHSVNVGLLCGHKCTYCSTPAMIRAHSLFKKIDAQPLVPK